MAKLIDADTPINEYLSFKISVLYRLMVRRSARFLNSTYKLSVAESPATVSGIVELTQNDKAQVSRAVTLLIKKGLVRKEDNPEDKRSSLLFWLSLRNLCTVCNCCGQTGSRRRLWCPFG